MSAKQALKIFDGQAGHYDQVSRATAIVGLVRGLASQPDHASQTRGPRIAGSQPSDLASCCERLFALAEPTRMRIVHRLLTRGPVCVTELARELEMNIVKASHHLRLMRDLGMVSSERRGRFFRYSLSPGIVSDGNRLDLGCCQVTLITKA